MDRNGHHRGRQASPSLTSLDAWVFDRRKYADLPIADGEFPDLSPPLRQLLMLLNGLAAEARAPFLQGYCLGLSEPDRQLLLSVDPLADRPP
jgi:hypothetical protein